MCGVEIPTSLVSRNIFSGQVKLCDRVWTERNTLKGEIQFGGLRRGGGPSGEFEKKS